MISISFQHACICRGFVRLGEHNLKIDDGKHVDIDIKQIETNSEYNKNYGTNDIAMLYLERDAEITGN